jgi:hypothetical protein
MQSTQTKPNGPVAAVFLAAGIASLVLGITVVVVEAFPQATGATSAFDFSKLYGIGSGVGPLSGKVVITILSFAISWVVLHVVWRGKEVNFGRIFGVALILVAAGFILTFPPVFDVFAPKS